MEVVLTQPMATGEAVVWTVLEFLKGANEVRLIIESTWGMVGEMRVESNSQYTESYFQRQELVVQNDVRMSVELCELRSEKSEDRFRSRYD